MVTVHTLTVTQMEFSHDDRHLLTVSRDRQFSLLEKYETGDKSYSYKVIATKPKAHARILWGCSWSHDDALFATASRDGTTKVWSRSAAPVTSIELKDAATAVAFTPAAHSSGKYILAIGEENGRISLWAGGAGKEAWTAVMEIPAHLGHAGVVRRLRWRDNKNKDEKEANKRLQLASCSSDWSVRLFSLAIP